MKRLLDLSNIDWEAAIVAASADDDLGENIPWMAFVVDVKVGDNVWSYEELAPSMASAGVYAMSDANVDQEGVYMVPPKVVAIYGVNPEDLH